MKIPAPDSRASHDSYLFYCTSKRPLNSLKCDFEVTERGDSSTALQRTQVIRVEPAHLQEKNICVLKLASQNIPIIEKCKMKPREYALGHLGYTGTGTKDLWLLVKYVLCF